MLLVEIQYMEQGNTISHMKFRALSSDYEDYCILGCNGICAG